MEAIYGFDVAPADALARAARRAGRHRAPVVGVIGTCQRLEIPSLEEGFAEVRRVEEGVPRRLGAADR
jgi:hypothetical protein